MPLIPVVDLAFEEDAVIVADRDANRLRFDFSMPLQCIFDLSLDIVSFRVRPDLNAIQDPMYAGEFPNIFLGCLLLLEPIDVPRKGNPAIANRDLN